MRLLTMPGFCEKFPLENIKFAMQNPTNSFLKEYE